MAQVIPLPALRSRTSRRVSGEPMEAKIMLFTGVRYERLDIRSERSSDRPGTGSKRAKNK